ncbi:MAG: pyridoxamine 5'-phosphate oxidase, partial [Calditrichota bacterium]
VFYTNYSSLKGRQMAENPRAAILFYWGELQRQVRIEGPLKKLDPELSRAYFHSRPFESRLGAVASAQSTEIADRAVLERRFAELREVYANTEVPMPDHWGGIRLIPNYFEFWQGRKSRLHDRIYYRLEQENWKTGRLSP